jgi:hypothetical protein
MSTAPLVARVRINGPHHARVPAFCVQSGLRYFMLVGLIGNDLLMLRVCAFDGTLPSCLPLPGAKFMVRSAPGFVCPGCGNDGQVPFQCQHCRTNSDLLQTCFQSGRGGYCACGDHRVAGLGFCVRRVAPIAVLPTAKGSDMEDQAYKLKHWLIKIGPALGRAGGLKYPIFLTWALWPFVIQTMHYPQDGAGLPFYLAGQAVPSIFPHAELMRGEVVTVLLALLLFAVQIYLVALLYQRSSIRVSLSPLPLIFGAALNGVWYWWTGYLDVPGMIAGMAPFVLMWVTELIGGRFAAHLVFGPADRLGAMPAYDAP